MNGPLGDAPAPVLILVPLNVLVGDELYYPALGEPQYLGRLRRCVGLLFHAVKDTLIRSLAPCPGVEATSRLCMPTRQKYEYFVLVCLPRIEGGNEAPGCMSRSSRRRINLPYLQ